MQLTTAVYNIGQLPQPGTRDLSLPLRDYLQVLMGSLRILDGIRTGPLSLTIGLETELDSTRYHLATMVAMLEAALRRSGTDFSATAASVPNLKPALDRYLTALLRAKASWNAWLNGDSVSLEGFGADGTSIPTAADRQTEAAALDVGAAATSKPVSQTFMTLAIGLGTVAVLSLMLKR